jgi:transglutaminase-like putative cysteine protease
MDRHASAVCASGKSDCGGMSNLFVAVMRASQVPARGLFGRWATSAKKGEKVGEIDYYQWHVMAEFFADGVGWVPVDVSSSVLHDRSKSGLRCFGNDRGEFLTFHVDPDFDVDTGAFGVNHVGSLQSPAWWVTGNGTVDGWKANEDWQIVKRSK